MGRGGNQQQVQNSGNTLLNSEQQNTTTNQGNAQAAQSFLMPAYQNLYANPGYTPDQKSAITSATEGGTGAAFGAAAQEATNRAGRTNNSAGLTSTMDALARTRMQTAAEQTAQNETGFANAARGDQARALTGINSLYGTATGATNAGFGAQNSTLGTLSNNAANQKKGGFWNSFMDTLGTSLGGGNGTGAAAIGLA
jgi:hypothetical protein